jgi:hypothetical protein
MSHPIVDGAHTRAAGEGTQRGAALSPSEESSMDPMPSGEFRREGRFTAKTQRREDDGALDGLCVFASLRFASFERRTPCPAEKDGWQGPPRVGALAPPAPTAINFERRTPCPAGNDPVVGGRPRVGALVPPAAAEGGDPMGSPVQRVEFERWTPCPAERSTCEARDSTLRIGTWFLESEERPHVKEVNARLPGLGVTSRRGFAPAGSERRACRTYPRCQTA